MAYVVVVLWVPPIFELQNILIFFFHLVGSKFSASTYRIDVNEKLLKNFAIFRCRKSWSIQNDFPAELFCVLALCEKTCIFLGNKSWKKVNEKRYIKCDSRWRSIQPQRETSNRPNGRLHAAHKRSKKKFQRFCTQSFVFFRARFLLAVLFYTNNHRRIQMRRRRFARTVCGVNRFVVTKSLQNTTKTVHPNVFSYCLAQRTLPLHYNTFDTSSYQPLRKWKFSFFEFLLLNIVCLPTCEYHELKFKSFERHGDTNYTKEVPYFWIMKVFPWLKRRIFVLRITAMASPHKSINTDEWRQIFLIYFPIVTTLILPRFYWQDFNFKKNYNNVW